MLYLQPMRAERRARPLANDLSAGLRCAHTHAVLAFSGALRLLPVSATPLWRGEQSFCFVKVAEKRVGAGLAQVGVPPAAAVHERSARHDARLHARPRVAAVRTAACERRFSLSCVAHTRWRRCRQTFGVVGSGVPAFACEVEPG